MAEKLKEKIITILKDLNEKERELLSKVLIIEKEKLYQDKPRVKDDLLKAVREVYK